MTVCYSCQHVELSIDEGRSVIFQRGYDPYTQPTDFDLGNDAVEGFLRGDWGYVSLSVTVIDASGSLLGSSCLYGVAEWAESPCALGNVGAVEWTTAQALARTSAEVPA